MEIRQDFKPIEDLLKVFVEYSDVFRKFNMERWPHYKNKEDYISVYDLPDEKRRLYEKLYSDGRDMAHHFSLKLQEFNYPDIHANIVSYAESFKNGWLEETEVLNGFLESVIEQIEHDDFNNYALTQMCDLFKKQLEILEEVKKNLHKIKKSKFYMSESENKSNRIINYIKEHPLKTFSIFTGICSIISVVLYFIPLNATSSDIQTRNNSPVISGNNNQTNITYTQNQNTTNIIQENNKRINTLKTTWIHRYPNFLSQDSIVCSVEEGSKVSILEEKQNNLMAPVIKIKVLDGTCVGKIGWTGKEMLKRE